MAIGDAYAAAEELTERLGSTSTPPAFQDFLDAASREVESFTRRQFNKATVATARRFRPADWRRLPVEDFHTVTGLIVDVDGTVLDLADVDPQPWNGVVNGQTGWPFYNLIADSRVWSQDSVITVTAQWGWAAVPAPVKQATLDVAAAMLGGASPVRSESIDGYSVAYQAASGEVPPEMARLVKYRRIRFGVA